MESAYTITTLSLLALLAWYAYFGIACEYRPSLLRCDIRLARNASVGIILKLALTKESDPDRLHVKEMVAQLDYLEELAINVSIPQICVVTLARLGAPHHSDRRSRVQVEADEICAFIKQEDWGEEEPRTIRDAFNVGRGTIVLRATQYLLDEGLTGIFLRCLVKALSITTAGKRQAEQLAGMASERADAIRSVELFRKFCDKTDSIPRATHGTAS